MVMTDSAEIPEVRTYFLALTQQWPQRVAQTVGDR